MGVCLPLGLILMFRTFSSLLEGEESLTAVISRPFHTECLSCSGAPKHSDSSGPHPLSTDQTQCELHTVDFQTSFYSVLFILTH